MSDEDYEILVVPRDKLFPEKAFNGFLARGSFDYEKIILENWEALLRSQAESNFSYKQAVGYALLANFDKKLIFAYQREKDPGARMQRPSWQWSLGGGGHIEPGDMVDGSIEKGMLREFGEEVRVNGDLKINALGYINDDEDAFGKLHFAMLYLIETDATEVLWSEKNEMRVAKFIPVEEAVELKEKRIIRKLVQNRIRANT
ncbi:MAG: NUDIX domain-containing protein [archaeon]